MPAEQLFTENKLANLSGLDRRTVALRLQGVPPRKQDRRGRHYAIADVLAPLVKPATAQQEQEQAAHRLRADGASADVKELTREKMLGNLVDRETAETLWSDSWTKVRVCVMSFPGITADQREALVKELESLPIGGLVE